MGPNAYIIAGSNGAGKTTFAREFLPFYARCREFLNADMLAAGISPFDPDTAAFAAGRVLLARMMELTNQRKDFGFETTLSGRTYLPIFRNMKDRGYRLHLFYLWVPTVDLAIARVARRVKQGGHNVPEHVVRRRFDQGFANFRDTFLPLVDSWFLLDNSGFQPHEVARHEDGRLTVFDGGLYHRILSAPTKESGDSP
jgi:predicted ABC-type ATPase